MMQGLDVVLDLAIQNEQDGFQNKRDNF